MGAKLSIKDNILNSKDCPTKPLEIPEWGLTVHLRTWSAAEKQTFHRMNDEAKGDLGKLLGAVAVMAIAEPDGTPVFTPEDAPALAKKNAVALERILHAAIKHNALNKEAVDEAKNDLSESQKEGSPSV